MPTDTTAAATTTTARTDRSAGGLAGAVAFGPATLRFETFPWSLLRTPGLPLDVLTPMASHDAASAVDGVLSAERCLATLTTEFEREHLPVARSAAVRCGRTADLNRLVRARRSIRRGVALGQAQLDTWLTHGDPGFARSWQHAVAQRDAAVRRAEHAHGEAVRNAQRYLLERCAQPDVEHAVFLSSQDFFTTSFTPRLRRATTVQSGSGPRQTYATTARYLRRLSTRCELTSFFGPVHWVLFDPGEPAGLRLDPPGPPTVLVEPSIWLVTELNRLAQRDLPPAQRRPRRDPLVRDEGDHLLRMTDGRAVTVSASALALWRALDGSRTLEQACGDAGVDPAGIPDLLRELTGVLIPIAEIPAHDLAPFTQVLDRSPRDGPAHRIERLAKEFATTPWPQRQEVFQRAEDTVTRLGTRARRGQGRHYVDRYVFHEERTHPHSARTVLGAPAVAGLTTALSDVLPLSFLAALLRRADARDAVRAVTGGRPMPLLELLRRDVPASWTRSNALRDALAELVRARRGKHHAHLSREDIAGLVRRFCPPLCPDDCYGTLAGPDLMLLGDPAAAPWLLSELHDDGSYLGGGVSRLHPDGARVRAELRNGVVRVIDPTRMAAVVSRRRNMFLVPEMPGTAIELSGMSGKPRAETVPISEVTVEPDGAALRVAGRRSHLYTGDIPSVQHSAFAVPSLAPVPVSCGDWTPRVLVGSTVLQRARWRVDAPAVTGGYPGWQEWHRIRRRRGLPRRVFVRHPREQKPLFVDFADPLSVDDMVRFPAATLTLTEMLPDADRLWWHPERGAQCAELRTACFVHLDLGADR